MAVCSNQGLTLETSASHQTLNLSLRWCFFTPRPPSTFFTANFFNFFFIDTCIERHSGLMIFHFISSGALLIILGGYFIILGASFMICGTCTITSGAYGIPLGAHFLIFGAFVFIFGAYVFIFGAFVFIFGAFVFIFGALVFIFGAFLTSSAPVIIFGRFSFLCGALNSLSSRSLVLMKEEVWVL